MATDIVHTAAQALGYNDGMVQLVKDTIAKGTTDQELALFLMAAKRHGLDPFARQIFCVKRYDRNLNREVATPQTSIDGYRLIAERTGDYVPGRAATYTYDADGALESATAYVLKYKHGGWHEVSATAYYAEYVQTVKSGEPNAMWRKYPRVMLAKCAESLALRRAFPAELAGIYTAEEMGTEVAVAQPTRREKMIARIGELMTQEESLTNRFSPDRDRDLESLSESELAAIGIGITERLAARELAFDAAMNPGTAPEGFEDYGGTVTEYTVAEVA